MQKAMLYRLSYKQPALTLYVLALKYCTDKTYPYHKVSKLAGNKIIDLLSTYTSKTSPNFLTFKSATFDSSVLCTERLLNFLKT